MKKIILSYTKKRRRMTTTSKDLVMTIFDLRSPGVIVMGYVETPQEVYKRRYDTVMRQFNRLRNIPDEFFDGVYSNHNPYEKNWVLYSRMLHFRFKLKKPELTSKDEELLYRFEKENKERMDQVDLFGNSVLIDEVMFMDVEFHEMQKIIYMKSVLEYESYCTWIREFYNRYNRWIEKDKTTYRENGEYIYGGREEFYSRCKVNLRKVRCAITRRVRIGPKPDNDQKRCCTIM